MTNHERIGQLLNGERIVLSDNGTAAVIAERSGDGRLLRILRETAIGFTVLQTSKF